MSDTYDAEKGRVHDDSKSDHVGDVSDKGFHLEHIDAAATPDVAKVFAVRNAAFLAATKTGRLNPWSRESWVLYGCCFISFLCSCANGYDGSLMTGINIMPFYQKRFTNSVVGSQTGLIFSMYTIGSLVASWFSGPLTDYLGRKGGMFVGACIICIGSAVITSAGAQPQFLGGRFILGFGVAILTTAAPSYCVEICPPQWRGRMTGFYNCGWFGGAIPAAAIILGTSNINSDLSWRLPLIFQCVPSIVVICAVFFLPESPRWLMAHGREEEAHDFLVRYHGNKDPANPIVQLEWHEFQESIALDASDKRFWDYSELFRTSSNRWRFFMVILMGVFGQFSGNGLGYFNTQIYAAVGYDTHQQWVLNLGSQLVSCFGAAWGVVLADKMPRRTALIWGTLLSALFLGINGGLSRVWAHTENPNLSIGQAAVASYFLFNIVYSFAYTPLQALYPVECLQTTARAKGMAMYAFVVGVISFINLYCTPIALQNIQYNYVFIFLAWDVVEAFLWWCFCVETLGRTLEELEEIFAAKYPPRASTRKQKVAIKTTGTVAVVDHE